MKSKSALIFLPLQFIDGKKSAAKISSHGGGGGGDEEEENRTRGCAMRLLRADGGMHGGIHKARSRPLFGPVDLRALLGGGEGRGGTVGEDDRDGGGDESAHEFL